ncbi:MAG: 1,4-alpha-glucan branching protein GlgB [Ignavibacteria bacterium]|nr:1,4-alpha-glucan branching protein GlgB [Ignavibacteria bacterium]
MNEEKYKITDFDLYLLGEGNHFESYEKFGSKLIEINGIIGVQFVVWAPNAKEVSVVGDFNGWNPEVDKMENINNSGVWFKFIPDLNQGTLYKYAIKSFDNDRIYFKTDPYAYYTEIRPKTASVVYNIDNYIWNDENWMEQRKHFNFIKSPISIYEIHLGSWKKDYNNIFFPNQWGYKNYKQIVYELVEYVKDMGYTHIELLPIMEHPLDESWGYQVINYFAPTSRYGTPEDFMFFVDYCHQNNIGVILDWVPAHFPTDDYGLANYDSTQLYAYKSWKKGFHKDWGTLIFDYGRNEVVNFLISNALFWFKKYHIDGLRVDAVASMLYLDYSKKDGEWEPNCFGGRENLEAIAFLKKLNEVVHSQVPGIMMIAEESTAFYGVTKPTYLGGLGFDMKWNMGWMNDILNYFSKDPVYRKYHQNQITFSLWYAFNENFVLPISHDEVVHGKGSLINKMPGDLWQKFANLRLFFGFMFGHPGKKLNFMGNDFAQFNEWNFKSSLDWHLFDNDLNKKFNKFFKDLNFLYRNSKAMHEIDFSPEGFQWVDFSDADSSIVSFLRFSENRKEVLLFTYNFTPVPRYNYQLGVPYEGYYREILNSDATEYGGSGIGNLGGVHSVSKPRFLCNHSIFVTLPPLAVNIFKLESST